MPYSPNTKTTSLEWHQWPALDLSIHNLDFDVKIGITGSAASEAKAGIIDSQSLQGARAVGRTLLQCLKQVEKIDDGSSTQELQASILANSNYGSLMSGDAHSCLQSSAKCTMCTTQSLMSCSFGHCCSRTVSDVLIKH
jgi:hypothetical protein